MQVLILVIFFLFSTISFAEDSMGDKPVYFKDYQAIFAYIADREGVDTDPNTIIELAADSSIEYDRESKDLRIIITANYINKKESKGVNEIRGASGNGCFYIFESKRNGYNLIGILEGNGYKKISREGQEQYSTSWHMSAFEYGETIYQFNGKVFKAISHRNVKDESSL